MMLKHLINPKPSIILSFIIFCALISGVPLITEKNVFTHGSKAIAILTILLKIILCILLSAKVNRLIYTKDIIRKDNIIIGVVFVLLSSLFINNIYLLLSGFFMLFLIKELIDSYQKENPFSQYYNSSLILSILTLMHPNLILLYLLLIINSINYSNLNWRILFTVILGFLTPYIYYFSFALITENEFLIPDFFNFSKKNNLNLLPLALDKRICLILLCFVLTISFFELFNWLYKKSIKSRKTFMNIIWMLVITLTISFYSESKYLYFSIIPLTIIISNYFIYSKNRTMANILFYLFVISSTLYNPLIIY